MNFRPQRGWILIAIFALQFPGAAVLKRAGSKGSLCVAIAHRRSVVDRV